MKSAKIRCLCLALEAAAALSVSAPHALAAERPPAALTQRISDTT